MGVSLVPECEPGFFANIGLRYECDKRVLLWVLIYHVTTYIAWQWWPSAGLLLRCAMIVHCALWSFFGATITHNAIHVPLFHSATSNSWFQIALSHTYGWPVSALVPGHNLSHHKFTNTDRDTMRPDRMRYSWNLLNYLLFPSTTAAAIAASDKEYMRAQQSGGRPIWKQYVVEAVSFYPAQVMLGVTCPERYFFLIFIPQMYAKFQIIAMNILQHDGCPPATEDAYNNSRNFVGRVVNYFTFNNGYHTIHHTNPGWHWYRLPESHDRIIKPHIHPNLDQQNILSFFFEAHIYPGKRMWYDGSEVCTAPSTLSAFAHTHTHTHTQYKLPPFSPDRPWYNGTTEVYSDAAAVQEDAEGALPPTSPEDKKVR